MSCSDNYLPSISWIILGNYHRWRFYSEPRTHKYQAARLELRFYRFTNKVGPIWKEKNNFKLSKQNNSEYYLYKCRNKFLDSRLLKLLPWTGWRIIYYDSIVLIYSNAKWIFVPHINSENIEWHLLVLSIFICDFGPLVRFIIIPDGAMKLHFIKPALFTN